MPGVGRCTHNTRKASPGKRKRRNRSSSLADRPPFVLYGTPKHIQSPPKEPEALVVPETETRLPPAGRITSSMSTQTVETVPLRRFKPHWRMNDEELKKSVTIPEYLAEAMSNAVSSDGTDIAEIPPPDSNAHAPPCPLLVFINSRSGGRLGSTLLMHLADVISTLQVYDLARTIPDDVLRHGLGCLDKLAESGDECARTTRNNLRIMVAGGDGTVGWVLTSIAGLHEISSSGHVPPVGIIPLGTGNDLSRSFGWGGKFTIVSRRKVRKWLVRALNATPAPLDSWQVLLQPSPHLKHAHMRLPHCMRPVPLPDTLTTASPKPETAYEGTFRNYFSVGMDAQVAFGFHNFRNHMPWLARGRMANQMIYGGFTCTQGWFCTQCTPCTYGMRAVRNDVRLLVRRRHSPTKDWEAVHIPGNIRAIVILNLQSYAGGRNPWGRPSFRTSTKSDLEPAQPDDGLLEIVGLRDGWHTAFVMISVLTAIRLCQAEAVRLELCGPRSNGYLQMDGEPWQQPLTNPGQLPTVIQIERSPSQSVMLRKCDW